MATKAQRQKVTLMLQAGILPGAIATEMGYGSEQYDKFRRHYAVELGIKKPKGEYEPNGEDADTVRALVLNGTKISRIAQLLKLSVHELKEHYSYELETAHDALVAEAVDVLIRKMRKGDTVATLFLLKAKAGWQEADRKKSIDAATDAAKALSSIAKGLPGA